MRHRIPCRSAPQCSPQTRTTCALALRNVAHGPAHFRCAIRSQCCAQSAALPPCSLCAMPRTTCCPMQPLKSYNRMQMQLASSAAFPEPLLAAMPQLREKPRLGFSSKNPALHQGHEVCNSTTALGLQAALHLERIRSRFTGKERDNESGNDYFPARYYASTMGRWLSPDWSAKLEPVPYAKLENPQSLNLYAYIGNNPLIQIDPDGHWTCTGDNANGSACQAMKAIHANEGLVDVKGVDALASGAAAKEAQQQTPAEIVRSGSKSHTSANPEHMAGGRFAGTEIAYEVRNSNHHRIKGTIRVRELFTITDNTNLDYPHHESTWQTSNGRFVDRVGWFSNGNNPWPINYSDEIIQRFSVLQGSDFTDRTDIDGKNLLEINSDSQGNVTSSVTPQP